jgi:hypothetical protein
MATNSIEEQPIQATEVSRATVGPLPHESDS